MSPYSFLVKNKARELRGKGFSYREISLKLGVAKSMASVWSRDVSLSALAKARLNKISEGGTRKGRRARQKHLKIQSKKILTRVSNEVRSINSLDEIHIKLLLAMLFWCEGSKRLSDVRLTNSDPKLISLFLKMMRQSFKLDEAKFRCGLHLHSYHNQLKQLDYWAKMTHIPKSQFHRVHWKQKGGKRIHENYQGCLTLYYHDSLLAKELCYLYQEFIGAYFNGRMRVSKT